MQLVARVERSETWSGNAGLRKRNPGYGRVVLCEKQPSKDTLIKRARGY